VAGSLDGGSGVLAVYVNGTLGDSIVTGSRPLAVLDPTQMPGLGIGNVQSSNYSQYFNGLIDEVRISDQALPPSQFLIAKREPLIVIAGNVSRPYGGANPAPLCTIVGIEKNDPITVTCSTPASPASPVGTYPIVPILSDGGTGKLSEYTPIIINGTLTITPAPLIVTPANVTREFGTPNPALTGTIVGIQNGDRITATYSTTAALTSPIATYPITATLTDPQNRLPNYQVTRNQGTLTITADPLLVTTTADGGPGSLRSVLASAPAGSAVHFWSSVRGSIILSNGPLTVTKNVTLYGPGAAALAISGNNLFQVFRIGPAASVWISGLTIKQGHSENLGGGIYNDGTLLLTKSVVSGNFASPRGGGIYNSPTGALTINLSTVSGNSTTNAGGGIFNDGTMAVNNSTLAGNQSSDADGGAIYNLGTLSVSNSTLSGNGGSGAYGGAIRNDGMLTLAQITFAGNIADRGGALYNVGVLSISSSTLSSNKGVSAGGGIDNEGGAILVRNTIVAGNSISTGYSPDLDGAVLSLGHNLFGNTSGGSGYAASDLLNVNPLLGSLRYNGGPTQTIAPLPGSPAVDAGDSTDAPVYDQRGPGDPRIVGGRIDIGAFEVQPGPATHFQVQAPYEVVSGVPFTVSVTALDAYGHTATSYRGMVEFYSSDIDPGVVLPYSSTFTAADQGIHTFAGGFTLVSLGEQILTATDVANSTISGSVAVEVDSYPFAPPSGDANRHSRNGDSDISSARDTLVGGQIAAVDRIFASAGQPDSGFPLAQREQDNGQTDWLLPASFDAQFPM
jgi:hypothetical protein